MKLKTLLSLSTCFALLACANLPPSPSTSSEEEPGAAVNAAMTLEDYARSAVTLLDEAASNQAAQRIPLLEQACWAAARANNTELLQEALALYAGITLNPEQQGAFNTYTALLLALTDQPAAALDQLTQITPPTNPRTSGDYWLSKALAYRLLDDGEAATLMLVQRSPKLAAELQSENHQRIWDLQLEASRFLFSDPLKRYDNTTLGWLALGKLARQFWTNEVDVQNALSQWIAQFPGHPATNIYWLQAQEIANRTIHSAVRRIALLLPTGGRLADAATAVRDGFLAAHFASDARQLDIRVYDSSQSAVSSYEQAVADGAELIVGPLDKQQVESVIARNAGHLPMLALNYRDHPDGTTAVLEYGLAPEDDARSVALKALADGHTHAIAMVSNDDWGRRTLAAFSAAFAEGGGVVVDSREFHGSPKEYQPIIKDLLQLKQTQKRSEAIQRLLAEPLDTMPIRRQDVQFLFLAASPQQGRQLRPQFRFYHAADLPIYALGRIYGGTPNPRMDQDLNGVNFCAMPWVLDSSETWKNRRMATEAAWPQRGERYGRLYAMGTDAYLLASTLRNKNWSQLPVIAGSTGTLSFNQQRVVRTMPCARFVNGLPRSAPQDG